MSYIGFPVSVEEAIRLMEDYIRNQNEDPQSIQDEHHLNPILSKFTSLRLVWIDKNQYILGFAVADLATRFWLPLLSVDEAIILLIETKLKFKKELTRLNLDLSSITFCHMEDADSEQKFPEPLLFVGSL